MNFWDYIVNSLTPAKLKLLEAGIWAAGVGLLAGTLRIIANRMPMRVAVATLGTSVLFAVLVGLAVEEIAAVQSFKSAIIAVSAIAAKEWVEMIIRTVGKVRDRSDKIADGAVRKIFGEPPTATEQPTPTEEIKP
jgi:hypothetical protein